MKQGLQIRQAQGIVMTPQLTESIKILQLSSQELIPYITNLLEQNPFLERDESGDAATDNSETQPEEVAEIKIEAIDKTPTSWEDDEVSPAVYENDRLIYNNAGSNKGLGDNADNFLENISAHAITLREYVIDQINADIKDPLERMIAMYLTEYLDESGYIIQDLTSFSQILQCDYQQIDKVIKKLQKFDPAGVFARDLAECLALQLSEHNRLDPAMQLLLDNLDLMAKYDLKALKKICGVDEADLKEMFAEIKALNPKPGNNFLHENIQLLQADIFLRKDAKGKLHLELNNEALPRVLVNRRYYAQIEAQVQDKESKKFLSENWNTGNWLAKALDMRANTILKVATQIVLQQDEFFKKGIHYLKPLVIADIAGAVAAHESTVSRVINGKYMATPMGIFELKYFFSSGIASKDSGEDISSKRIKHIIKQLVDAEDPKKILSDDKITALLQAKGIDVARRTVMKYREALHIPSSVQRRREKKMD